MTWSNLSDQQREEAILAYFKTPTYKSLTPFAEAWGIPVSTLQRRCQEGLETQPERRGKPPSSPSSPAPLTNFEWIDPDTDQGRFVTRLHELQDNQRYIKVMHACDFHFPYHHKGATQLFYELTGIVQPHLMAVGSDTADFDLISRFNPTDKRKEEPDVLDEFDSYYTPHIHNIHDQSPSTSLFFLIGNHEKRIYDFILRQAPQIRQTVWNRFMEIIRVGGLVHWLGETDYCRAGPLIVMHGNRTTINPAKSMLEDGSYQYSLMAGHVHKKSTWERRGEEYSVIAVTSGCHQIFPAPYMKRIRPTHNWQLGTAIAQVDLQGREVFIDNLEYYESKDLVWTTYQGQKISVDNPRPDGLLTYSEYLERSERSGS